MSLSVADELLYESLPAEVRRIAETRIADVIEDATEKAELSGFNEGHGAGYNEGFNAGVIEGRRRERDDKASPAA